MKNLNIFMACLLLLSHSSLARVNRKPHLTIIQLAEPKTQGTEPFEQVLGRRKSIREFSSEPLSNAQISQLVWAGQGIVDKEKGYRTAPSTGDIYPINLYVSTKDGSFLYEPQTHSLRQLSDKDVSLRLSKAALKERAVADAPCSIVIAGSAKKISTKYGSKAKKFMYLEAGHIAQNILLQATSMNLGSIPISAFDTRNAAKLCKIPTNFEPLYIISIGHHRQKAPNQTATASSQQKRIVLLIAPTRNFSDEELFVAKRQLEKASVQTVIASTKTGTIRGMLGGTAQSEILLSNVILDNYDAIVFIGGSGARDFFDSRTAMNIARNSVHEKKILAAISIAPVILANAGILDGVRATCFETEQTRLANAGALYTGSDVERDGLIITAKGPQVTGDFAKAILTVLGELK